MKHKATIYVKIYCRLTYLLSSSFVTVIWYSVFRSVAVIKFNSLQLPLLKSNSFGDAELGFALKEKEEGLRRKHGIRSEHDLYGGCRKVVKFSARCESNLHSGCRKVIKLFARFENDLCSRCRKSSICVQGAKITFMAFVVGAERSSSCL